MKILRYVSDLHLESYQKIDHPNISPLWDFKKNDNDQLYLALLGNIGNPYKNNLNLFLEKIHPVYKKIFYVPGDHEYHYFKLNRMKYNKEEFDKQLMKSCQRFDNVFFLNNNVEYIDNIKIIGSPLWFPLSMDNIKILEKQISEYWRRQLYHPIKLEIPNQNIEHMEKILNDYFMINEAFNQNVNQWNLDNISFIKENIINDNESCIILTRYPPLSTDSSSDLITGLFHNKLIHLIKKPISAWLFGHRGINDTMFNDNIFIGSNNLTDRSHYYNPYAHLNLRKFELDS